MRRLAPNRVAHFSVVFLLLAVVIAPAFAANSKRFALVIGNSSYTSLQPLPNAVRDAEKISEALTDLDFKVFQGIDLTAQQFAKLVEDFQKEVASADAIVFYYAGHGFQLNDFNFLVPVDAKLKRRNAIRAETFALNEIIARIRAFDRQTIILVDACRNNPLPAGGGDKATAQGLAQPHSGDGIFIAYSTQPGNVSVDGSGANSPFAKALLAHINTPHITISDLMIRVRDDVKNATFGKQVPWDQSSLNRQFCFKPEASVANGSSVKRAMVIENPDNLTKRDANRKNFMNALTASAVPIRPSIGLNPDNEASRADISVARTPNDLRSVPKPGMLKQILPKGIDLKKSFQQPVAAQD